MKQLTMVAILPEAPLTFRQVGLSKVQHKCYNTALLGI